MNIQPLTYKKFILGILGILIIVFLIKLFNTYKNTSSENIENFENILRKLKANSKEIKRTSRFKNTNNVKLKKKVTFDDLLKETEDMDVEKYSISNIKKNFFDYVNSFKKDKFKNTSGTTTEALEKFDYFKEKFYEIFI
jgi:hypothetical protein